MRRVSFAVPSFARSSVKSAVAATATATTTIPVSVFSKSYISGEAIERASNARSAINSLWIDHSNDHVSPLASSSSFSGDEADERAAICSSSARKLMDDFRLTPQVPRDDDVTHALGESFERLLILLVPLTAENVPYLERLLLMAARTQYEISIRTVQHLFARTRTYAEALTLFHQFRTCHVKMNLHSYYAMIYCLQRLEEESWALRFKEEAEKGSNQEGETDGKKEPSLQALSFILRGCENQLLPESKPWLGRVAFADRQDNTSAASKTGDYDALGSTWAKRFKKESDQTFRN